ncbi:zinc carboxypeptidase [Robertkochia marina]|uniref:Zinc carboxypeptidase n=1 Tax=Robertkochia marina TaxID=1227945 RepID=A0A4S3LXA4_9FLAO|nr:M14 family zinc carboxypeptidase [Robertkochia marina]THD65826.1 zinc carboxypeptidase [Robertkochia marina]TRZ41329.1 zinc carboxypeptidase [Robertkochia marina]
MKRLTTLFLSLCGFITTAQNAPDLDYYLPGNTTYNENIPTPSEVIGHKVGEWHVTHDKLMNYMYRLAGVSDRIAIENRGSTYEGRPILLLTITSPENHANLENIRQNHLALTTGNSKASVSDMPVVVYQGFSIHGNEPSGSNAALALAYYLAAAQGEEINTMLNNTVILFDPSFNPDGLQRFSYWANTNRAHNLNADNNDREYHEVWPGGRTNHYWFDLNRDWLPVQLPESRARIATFHKWKPNILTDHHEMGTNSTFFFQPGEPMRVHPLTPDLNQKLTASIGKYHADALDQIGSLYYSEENYDDYYYGKGSTFPDVNGGVGILFEQGSSRGHIQESENGTLTFPFTIRNQFTTGLSTLKAANALREDLLTYQRDFYNQASKEGENWIFGDSKDAAKTFHLAEILDRHEIDLYELSESVSVNGKTYEPGYSYVIPKTQKNGRLVQAMFEKRTTFKDSLFYDISGWTFPLAFNVDYDQVKSVPGNAVKAAPELKTGGVDQKGNYAYLFEWHEYYTPKALNEILNAGLRAKVGKTPFELEGRKYDYGTIMVPVQNQSMDADAIYEKLNTIAKNSHINIYGVNSGLTRGIDLGSNDFEALKPQKIAMLVGEGIRSYDAGEIWHLFDQRYDITLTKLDLSYFNRTDISEYTTIIVPSINDWAIDERGVTKIKEWVQDGGNLVGFRNSVEWMEKKGLLKVTFKKHEEKLKAKNISFEQAEDFRGAQVTGGAIFQTKTDRSHPLNWGYKNNEVAMFRNTNIYMEANEQSYNNPMLYTQDPLLSGYISEENLELLKNSAPFQTNSLGRGQVSGFTDNTNFRAFWYGTNKLLMNAIFFGKIM